MPQPCFHIKGMFHYHSTLIMDDGNNIMALQVIYMWHDKQENQTNKKERQKQAFQAQLGWLQKGAGNGDRTNTDCIILVL